VLDANRRPWVRFIGPFLITAGGLATAVSCWLNWFIVTRRLVGSPRRQGALRGVQYLDGQLIFGFALIAIGGGVLIVYFATRQSYVWIGAVSLFAGLWIAFFSTFDAVTREDRYVDEAAAIAAEQGVPKDQAVIFFRGWVESGVVTIRVQPWIWVAAAAGGMVVLGAAASLLTRPVGQEGEPAAEEPEEDYDYLSDEAESVYEPE
jgi:hypothetical protein